MTFEICQQFLTQTILRVREKIFEKNIPLHFPGGYIYAESSKPRVPGNRAVLLSPRLRGPYCLQLHLHMLGTSMGSLNAYKNSRSRRTKIFSFSGNRGDQWYTVQSSLTGAEQFQVN